MGQSGISMLNKTGYSMFWNSMWDNKISYNRHFKEDIFLNKFFLLGFNDNLSNNFISEFKNLKKNSKFTTNQNINLNKVNLKNYLLNLNKIEYFSSKLWVFRYQNWLILYHFIFITNSNKNNNNIFNNTNLYKNNFSNVIDCYKKSTNLNNFTYSNFNKKINNFIF